MSDPGQTHHVGDDCPGGHAEGPAAAAASEPRLDGQVEVALDLDELWAVYARVLRDYLDGHDPFAHGPVLEARTEIEATVRRAAYEERHEREGHGGRAYFTADCLTCAMNSVTRYRRRAEAAEQALRDVVEMWDACLPSIQEVESLAYIHGWRYGGPAGGMKPALDAACMIIERIPEE